MPESDFRSGASGGGEPGPQGPTGPKGEYTHRGAWVVTTVYAKGDAVTKGGSTYACTVAHTAEAANEPPNAGFWAVLAEKGAAGAAGAPGAEGPKGTTGAEGPKGEVTWRGAWAGGTTYAKGDAVREGGTSYVSTKTANTGHEPKLLGEWWEVLAEKGATGAEGAAGPKPLVEHAFAINGKLAVEAYPGYTVRITAPEEKNIEGMDLRCEEGTECEVTIRKNAAALGASYEKVVVKKGTPVRVTSSVALADKDYLDINVIAITGAPGKLSVTLQERQVK